MSEEELAALRETVARLEDGLVATQAIAVAAQYVMRELMAEVALREPDPDRFLTDLYDLVAVRLDRGLDHLGVRPVLGEALAAVGLMFRDARRRVSLGPPEPPQGGETPRR